MVSYVLIGEDGRKILLDGRSRSCVARSYVAQYYLIIIEN